MKKGERSYSHYHHQAPVINKTNLCAKNVEASK